MVLREMTISSTSWHLPQRLDVPDMLRMNNLYHRFIEDILDDAGISWHGWHASRRELATNLPELGVPADVCQRILRHGDIDVTQANYRKTRNPKVDAAMNRLSQALSVLNRRQLVDSQK
jgi:integrase